MVDKLVNGRDIIYLQAANELASTWFCLAIHLEFNFGETLS